MSELRDQVAGAIYGATPIIGERTWRSESKGVKNYYLRLADAVLAVIPQHSAMENDHHEQAAWLAPDKKTVELRSPLEMVQRTYEEHGWTPLYRVAGAAVIPQPENAAEMIVRLVVAGDELRSMDMWTPGDDEPVEVRNAAFGERVQAWRAWGEAAADACVQFGARRSGRDAPWESDRDARVVYRCDRCGRLAAPHQPTSPAEDLPPVEDCGCYMGPRWVRGIWSAFRASSPARVPDSQET